MQDGNTLSINHGATIVATGGREYRGKEYGYGTDAAHRDRTRV